MSKVYIPLPSADLPVRVRRVRAEGLGPPARYDRNWDLPRLIAMWPHQLEDVSVAGRQRVIERLRQALRAERQRGIGGHWTYDLTRHAQLLVAYRMETAAMREARDGAARAGASQAHPASGRSPQGGSVLREAAE